MARTTEDQWRAMLDGWRELGATHVSFNTMGASLTSPQDPIDAIRRFREVAGD